MFGSIPHKDVPLFYLLIIILWCAYNPLPLMCIYLSVCARFGDKKTVPLRTKAQIPKQSSKVAGFLGAKNEKTMMNIDDKHFFIFVCYKYMIRCICIL